MLANPHSTRSNGLPPRADLGLTPLQSRAVAAGILALHLLVGWALLQIDSVRAAAAEAAPMLFEMVREPDPVPRPSPARVVPKYIPPAPLVAAATPAAAGFVTAAPERAVATVDSAPEIPAPPAPPAPVAAPHLIPPTAIQYLVPPQMVYPRASRPFREAGRVITRVFVDEAGVPRTVQISKSSGFPRLDDAAIAAVLKARFRPYAENGQPASGWALIPLTFEVE